MGDSYREDKSGAGCLIRIYWLCIGNILAAYLALFILEKKAHLFTFIDILFWLTVVSIVVSRYVDVRFMHGETNDGKPATMSHWRRHSTILLIAAGAAWAIVHLFVARGG